MDTDGADNGYLEFLTGVAGINPRMRIDKNGNVGIGTISPTNMGTGSGAVLDTEGVIQVSDAVNATGKGMNMQVLHTETLSAATATSNFSPPKTDGNGIGILMAANGGGNSGMIVVVQTDDEGTFSVNSILGQSGAMASASLVKTAEDNWQIQGMTSNSNATTVTWIGISH